MKDAAQGLRIQRRFTTEGRDPFDAVVWERRDSRITNPDGSVVFEMEGAEVPASWSQVATDIIVSKYFRKAGVPQTDEQGEPILDAGGSSVLGPERSARQTIGRLAATWRHWGEHHGYFASAADAQAFEDELRHMLVNQMGSPNSPQWFNTGLHHAHGITGTAEGFWYVDPDTGEVTASPDSYSRPAPHACFPAGTKVTTIDGSVEIEKVHEGDVVLTHRGRYRRVVEVMQRQVSESLVQLFVGKLSAEPIRATINHPFLAVTAEAARHAADAGTEPVPSWVEAGDLSAGDYVVIAEPLAAGLVPEALVVDGVKLDLSSPRLVALLGRWIGNGLVGHDEGAPATVCFVVDELDAAASNDIESAMAAIAGVGADRRSLPERRFELGYRLPEMAAWLAETFGEGSNGRSLPSWALHLPREQRVALLAGLFAATGIVQQVAGYRGLTFDVSSAELAQGIWRLVRSLGYAPSLAGSGQGTPGVRYWVHVEAADAPELATACGVGADDERDTWTGQLRVGDLVAYRVSEARTEPFYGTVYNFQVEDDESYVVNGVAVHNCFIQSVADDLVNDGGIMDLWVREARLFKFGSGTGTNFSSIRAEGEPLSGGGKSSGLMSFLRVGDRAAGAIKSGGTTRRAAKMVILDLDHPDIEAFVDWKVKEERKVRALIAAGYESDFNGEAYQTVSGQNSNNSVRIPNEFVEAVQDDGEWELTSRTDGEVVKTIPARELWEKVAAAAWECADPGVQFDTTINEWHTCPAGGRIRASNPCSEYMFLDNTACNLASLNLTKFYDDESGEFDIEGYRHAIRLWTMVLEISVTMAQFPSVEIAQGSYDYRTLGLGYANLGSLLMRQGIPYDSEEGRAIAGALTAVLTGEAYATSAEMASVVGAFPRYRENREAMLRVIRNHRRAAYDADDYEGITTSVVGIDPRHCPADLLAAARHAWDQALEHGEKHGFRNAQVSVIAPTGTIGLQMDCDTTGVEPDFALVKFKKLAGGGYFKIANRSIQPALRHLGYAEQDIAAIVDYVVGTMTLAGAPHINKEALAAKGLTAEEVAKVEAQLSGVFELRHAFSPFVLGTAALERLGFTEEQYGSFGFDLLAGLGFTAEQIRQAGDVICGRQTIEGAPGLEEEDLAVFDTANRNGRHGKRFIHHTGHIRMMAAAQPFISGAISKTINMPNEVTVSEIEDSYMLSWELGLKAMALYRDGSKASQPLSATADEASDNEEEAEALAEALEEEARTVTGFPANGLFSGISPSQAYAGVARPRFLLPARRVGWTQEARIGGHKVFLRSGEYDDGTIGELFIDLAKEGATLRGVLSCFAIAVSKGLQYGVPLEEFVDTFTFHTFEPRGMVEGHPNIKMANSIVDYVFRALGMEYLGRNDLVQVPPVDNDLPEPPKGIAVDAGVQLGLQEAAAEDDLDAVKEAAAFVDGDPWAPRGNGKKAINLLGRSPAKAAASTPAAVPSAPAAAREVDPMASALGDLMGDAPLCDTCGHITVRNGSCYRCFNCGNSMGCS